MTKPRKLNRHLAACADAQVWRRTLLIGLPVGFLQAALNQGDHWWRHQVDAIVVTKTLLCPLLSCSIVLISAVCTRAEQISKSTTSS